MGVSNFGFGCYHLLMILVVSAVGSIGLAVGSGAAPLGLAVGNGESSLWGSGEGVNVVLMWNVLER